jgi:hypothetical protein
MRDAQVARLAGAQSNRFSRRQLYALGIGDRAIARRVASGRWVLVEEGVFAVAPVLDDPWGRWMAATLTAPGSVLSHASAAAAWGFASGPRQFETVSRPGSGGPRRHGGVLAFRSRTLEGECELLRGVPITSVPRTLLDFAASANDRALARAMREAVRLGLTSLPAVSDCLLRHRGRRGTRRVGRTISRYSGLPLERARSGLRSARSSLSATQATPLHGSTSGSPARRPT